MARLLRIIRCVLWRQNKTTRFSRLSERVHPHALVRTDILKDEPLLAGRFFLLPFLTFLLFLLFFLRRQRFRRRVLSRWWLLRLRWRCVRLWALVWRRRRWFWCRLVLVRLGFGTIVRLRWGRAIRLWSIVRSRWLRLCLWPSRFRSIVRLCRRRPIYVWTIIRMGRCRPTGLRRNRRARTLTRGQLIARPIRWSSRGFGNRLSWLGRIRLARWFGRMAHGCGYGFARRSLLDHGTGGRTGWAQGLQLVFR